MPSRIPATGFNFELRRYLGAQHAVFQQTWPPRIGEVTLGTWPVYPCTDRNAVEGSRYEAKHSRMGTPICSSLGAGGRASRKNTKPVQ
eukprot:3460489-Rhodomonas_salina.4